jgi:acetoin utilization deacetylase AcuC-like enzyme
VNLPFPPGTGGASYLKAFEEIVPPITHQFKPEVFYINLALIHIMLIHSQT